LKNLHQLACHWIGLNQMVPLGQSFRLVKLALLFLGIFSWAILSACRSVSIPTESIDDYTLTMVFDKKVYRPEECVVTTLTLKNNTHKIAQLRGLDAGSVSFFFGSGGDTSRMKRSPVFSKKETFNPIMEVQPGASKSRQFLLTRLTHYKGPLVAQAHYEASPSITTGPYPKLYSNTVSFQVAGEPLFGRDSEGYLTKKSVIEVARAQTPGEVKNAEAIMYEDMDTGFYVWHVNVTTVLPGQQPTVKAWLINPYTGKIKGEAKPFNPQLAADPHIQQRPHEPPRPRTDSSAEKAQ
jgi:hypothetical protein